MQQSLPSRLLGHYEYEIKLPIPKNNNAKRRTTQIIQANLNTTILEMIEEACTRQGYEKVQDYALCFEGKVLESSVTIRHSGLPTRGVLDLILKVDIPKETSVNVGLQLASGKRLMHKFNVEETLWSILEHWESQGEKIFQSEEESEISNQVPVCNFLRQTIVGKEQLKEKTLRSIDLTRGSGIIRFFYRVENQVGVQANVSASLPRPSGSKLIEENRPTPQTQAHAQAKNVWNQSQESGSRAVSSSAQNVLPDQVPVLKQPIVEERRLEANVELNNKDVNNIEQTPKSLNEEPQSGSIISSSDNPNGASKEVDAEEEEKMDCSEKVLQFASPGQLFILGENNAMLYHGDDVETMKVNDEPDDFYAVTSKDVESIYRDLKAKRAELEEAPLLTSSLRNTDETSANERILREHPNTTVRIRFPDRFVLQGSFATTDSIAFLYDFVRRYLSKPDLQFYLFTAPPKNVLDSGKTFLQQTLLGLAIVYFGCDTPQQDKYLKEQLYSQVSDPNQVFKNSSVTCILPSSSGTSLESGGETTQSGSKNNSQPTSSSYGNQSSSSSANASSTSRPTAGPSSSGSARTNRSNASNSGAVPKWFKSSMK